MNKIFSFRFGLAAVTATTTAAAQNGGSTSEPDRAAAAKPTIENAGSGRAIEIETRVGYGIPLGEIAPSYSIAEFAGAQVPFGFGIGYRLNPHLSAGVMMQYGIVKRSDETQCVGLSMTCLARDTRLGAAVHYRVSPDKSVSPWVGLGVGYEWFTVTSSSSIGAPYSARFNGVELANLEVGADFKAAPGLALGPYLSGSLDQFISTSHTEGYSTDFVGTTSIEEKAYHAWLMVGVRGTYDVGL